MAPLLPALRVRLPRGGDTLLAALSLRCAPPLPAGGRGDDPSAGRRGRVVDAPPSPPLSGGGGTGDARSLLRRLSPARSLAAEERGQGCFSFHDSEPEFFVLTEDESPCIFGPIVKQRWSYASKQLIERLIFAEGAENDLEFTIVRPFNWIGPRMDFIPGVDGPSEGVPRVLACFSNNLLRREPMKLVDGGEVQRTFLYIKDAIEAVVLMIVYANVSGEPPLEEPVIDVSAQQFYGEGYDDSDKRIPGMTLINKQLVLLWLLVAVSVKLGRPHIGRNAVELMERRLAKDDFPEYYDGRAGRYVGKQARKFQTWLVAGYLVAKMLLDDPTMLRAVCLKEEEAPIREPVLTRSNSWSPLHK